MKRIERRHSARHENLCGSDLAGCCGGVGDNNVSGNDIDVASHNHSGNGSYNKGSNNSTDSSNNNNNTRSSYNDFASDNTISSNNQYEGPVRSNNIEVSGAEVNNFRG